MPHAPAGEDIPCTRGRVCDASFRGDVRRLRLLRGRDLDLRRTVGGCQGLRGAVFPLRAEVGGAVSVNLTNTAIKLLGVFPFEVSERLALLILCWRADENGETRMTKAELERQTGLSKPTVLKTIQRLQMMRLVSGKQLTVGVSALIHLLAESESAEGQTSLPSKGQTSLPFSEEKGQTSLPSGETERLKGFTSEGQDVLQKRLKDLTPYRQDYKTHTNACARACEGSSVSGEGAPTGDGQAESRVQVVQARPSSSLTVRVEAAEVVDKESLGLFLKEYPKRAMNRLVVCAEWAALEAEGFAGKRLLAAMREARMSKQWCEDGGRYVPRAEIFLHDRRFEDFLSAAAERASVKTHEQMLADEEAEARKRAAIDDIIAEEFFGGAPIESMEDVMARNAKRPEAEKIYEERKRAGTLKPVRLAIDEVREREAREKEASHV